jgi:hypothetical protein
MVVLRALRVLLPLAIVLAVVAVAVSVFTARPDIQHARRNVDRAWTPLSTQLSTRYRLLDAADKQLMFFGGPVHQLAAQVSTSLARWQHVAATDDVPAQVQAANELESLGRRLAATALATPQVKANQGVLNSVDAYAGDASFVAAPSFNEAVATYRKQRTGPIRGLVAAVLRDDDVPAFSPAPVGSTA